MVMTTADHLACLTSDLVESKSQPDRAAVQARLEVALQAANEAFSAELIVPLSITLGDEWQGLARSAAAAFRIDFQLRRALFPLAVRSGVGIGRVTTPTRERTSLMDGPCFHRSREALATAKKRRGAVSVLDSGRPELDEFVNAVERLLHGVMEDWTERQHESVMQYLDHASESAAADALGVAQPTLHKSVAGAHGKEILAVMEARNAFLERFGAGVDTAGEPDGESGGAPGGDVEEAS
jgi:hypothetical protein